MQKFKLNKYLGFAERHCRQKGYPLSNGHVEVVSWSDYSRCFDVKTSTFASTNGKNGYYQVIDTGNGQNGQNWVHSSADSEVSW